MAKNYSLRFDDDLSERFYKYCEINFISKNKLINGLIREYLDKNEKEKYNSDRGNNTNKDIFYQKQEE